MKKIPEIRFPEFSGEWVEKRLGEVCKIIMGQSPDSQFYNQDKNGLPLIQGANDFEKINNYTTKITKTCDKNDIIMSVRAPVGTLTKAKAKSCIGRGVCAIKGNNFIYYLLINNQNKLRKYSQGSTFEAINSKDLKSLKLHIPPTLAEQQKIAEFLSKIDKKIEIVTKKIEELKQYKKGLLQKMLNVTDKGEPELRFKEFSGKWVEKKLGEILYEIKKEKVSKENISNFEVLNVKLHTKGLEKTGKKPNITEKGRPYYLTEIGDILIGKQNFHNGSIGIVTKEFEKMVTSNAILHLREKGVEKIFIYYYLSRRNFYKRIEYLLGGTGQKEISKSEFFNLKVIIPPTLAEQQKIANFISSIDEKIELNENKLKALKKYKQGLLQKMFV